MADTGAHSTSANSPKNGNAAEKPGANRKPDPVVIDFDAKEGGWVFRG